MQRLEVSGAARPIYGSLGVKRLINNYVTVYEQNKHRAPVSYPVSDFPLASSVRRNVRPVTRYSPPSINHFDSI